MLAQRLLRGIALVQGIYYVASGVWPILHLRSFYLVTGPKKEGWLVKTVGALVAAVGAGLLASAKRGTPSPDMALAAAGSAAALAAVDVVYVTRGRIRPVYLLDALPEAMLVIGWVTGWLLHRREMTPRRSTHIHVARVSKQVQSTPGTSVAGLETDPYATPTI